MLKIILGIIVFIVNAFILCACRLASIYSKNEVAE